MDDGTKTAFDAVAAAKATWALQLTQPKREVLRAYLDFANEDGMSNPGIQQIAWMTDYHVRQVQRITHALEQDGILVPTPRAGKTTEYRFDLSAVEKKPAMGEVVTFVTPDTIMSSPEMSPLTHNVTPDISTHDIQMSPPNPFTQARAVNSSLSSLGNSKDKDLNTKDKKTTTTTARVTPSDIEADPIWKAYAAGYPSMPPRVNSGNLVTTQNAINILRENVEAGAYTLEDITGTVRWQLAQARKAKYFITYVDADMSDYLAYRDALKTQDANGNVKTRASPKLQEVPKQSVLSPTSRGAPDLRELKNAGTS